MKNSRQGFSNFLMIFCLLLLLLSILARLFLPPELWHLLISVVSVAGALYAVSDLFKKSADDQKNMSLFASSLITPLYEAFSEKGMLVDAAGKDLSKTHFRGSGEFERLLRISSDMRERTVLELLWEHRNLRTRQNSSRGNAVVSVLFLLLSLIVLIGSVVVYFLYPQWIPNLTTDDFVAVVLCSLAIILACAFASGSVLRYLQETELILALKQRCEAMLGSFRPSLPYAATPDAAPPAVYSAPAETVESAPQPSVAPSQETGGRRKKRHGHHNSSSVFVPAEEPVASSPTASESTPAAPTFSSAESTPVYSSAESSFVSEPVQEAAPPVSASNEAQSATESASPFVSEDLPDDGGEKTAE